MDLRRQLSIQVHSYLPGCFGHLEKAFRWSGLLDMRSLSDAVSAKAAKAQPVTVDLESS